jgi:hypothetical protein
VSVKKWSEIKKDSKVTPDASARAKADLDQQLHTYSLAEIRRGTSQ